MKRPITILCADDDPDDRMLMREAFEESLLTHELQFVEDGEELMHYLRREGRYASRKKTAWPGIILLDLNMPRKDGREALREIKADPHLRQIPIIVMTTSKAEEDIVGSYELGVSSFISKPVTFNSLLEVLRTLGKYWFEIVELPPTPGPYS